MIKINNLASVIFILLISIILAYVSFGGKQSEAYLFPKIITSVMIILSSLSLVVYFFDKTKKMAEINISKLSIYLISLILFIFFGEILGFYFLTIILFLIVCYFYSEHKSFKVIIYNILITSLFMLFIYFLFSILLKVQVPRFFLL
tara:strand:- start:11 stop:448 length:438 start_codon:yes stop_codon:yes gene_type:complete